MSPSEWDLIVTKILDLWGASSKWTNARVAVYEYARNLDYTKTVDVISGMFTADRATAPSPSEVVSKARTAGALEVTPASECPHTNYAILEYHSDGTARLGLCAACHREFTWHPGQVRTVGELDRIETDPEADPAEAEQTVMIAP